ncbi:restriction endonuclease subunit S [Gordonia mangrovi]|uniref:restriction endonuclease subunit S n=1 Tax=Gordonia mangrovi TaxID=2665643 RepID=UPI001926F7B0|nr:restriction endonuclease subunit S [Gordonia mangrovi]UVF76311.1 restriction endonuclease subunit S [Gordonia mangrovi]
MSWPQVALGEVAGVAGPKAGEAGSRLPVYSVTKHRGFVRSSDYFNKQVFSRDLSGYRTVKAGQFAYATIHLDEGSVGIAPEDSLVSPMYTVFEVNPALVEPRYLLRYLKSARALAVYPSLGSGSAERRKAIPFKRLASLNVPLPPLPEQRRIAAILDHADALRAKRRETIARLDELKQSIFIDMFGDPSANPRSLPIGSIGELVESARYGTSEKSSTEGKYPVLRMGNLTANGRIDVSDLKYMDLAADQLERYTVRSGDLLFNRTNSPDLVGKTAVYRSSDPAAYAGYLIRVRTNDNGDPEYISGYLNSRHGKAVLRSMCKSIIGMANINARELQGIKILKPPIVDQRAYAQSVAAVEAHQRSLEDEYVVLNSLFSSLQSRAFRGEL